MGNERLGDIVLKGIRLAGESSCCSELLGSPSANAEGETFRFLFSF